MKSKETTHFCNSYVVKHSYKMGCMIRKHFLYEKLIKIAFDKRDMLIILDYLDSGYISMSVFRKGFVVRNVLIGNIKNNHEKFLENN